MMRFVRSERLMSDDELDKDCEVCQAVKSVKMSDN